MLSQGDAVRAFIKLGGVQRATKKKNYRMLTVPNGALLSIPTGTLKVGLLTKLIRLAGHTKGEFEEVL